jgi:acetylornithine aminotransferase
MGNGFPIGGVLISPRFEAKAGMLGTTFGGNHLACVAAISVLEVMEQEQLIDNARLVGEYLLAELAKIPQLKEIRGKGLMIGLEIEGNASELRKRLVFENHIFTGGAGATTIRLLPALSITCEQVDGFIDALKSML